jgi:hypothetical protein
MSEIVTIDPKRLARIKTLKSGGHSGITQGACIMEAVAYVRGQPWSDHPPCVSPVIGAYMRTWNDGIPTDAERTSVLLPLIPVLIDTVGSPALENRRATMAADWLIRVHTPAWLRLAGLTADADALASLPEITDFAQTPSLMGPLTAARKNADAARAAAGDAAWDVAGDAARAAAWDAAWDAARDAAGDAAGDAARDAAWDAAWAAAWDAARAAAWDAARAALKPTKDALQQSSIELVKRMCALREDA